MMGSHISWQSRDTTRPLPRARSLFYSSLIHISYLKDGWLAEDLGDPSGITHPLGCSSCPLFFTSAFLNIIRCFKSICYL